MDGTERNASQLNALNVMKLNIFSAGNYWHIINARLVACFTVLFRGFSGGISLARRLGDDVRTGWFGETTGSGTLCL